MAEEANKPPEGQAASGQPPKPSPADEPQGQDKSQTQPPNQNLASGQTQGGPSDTAPKHKNPGHSDKHHKPVGGEKPPSISQLEADIRQAKAESSENYDKYLRLHAEFENFKKRIQKEQSELLKYAQLPLLKDMTGVVDHLTLALNHAKENPGGDPKALIDGIDMVVKQMLEVFERFGMTPIPAKGKLFDPNHHEAMGMVEDNSTPANHVVQEFRTGYRLHERVVRPTMVTVSKGGAAPVPETPQEEKSDEDREEKPNGNKSGGGSQSPPS
ncbi:MAG: nucleotide exchange factor GrpE [Deltaproteobacteria bacterium]|nr:nucleotide exchange factor GrpE [Deltaproteobacteria bacterium]